MTANLALIATAAFAAFWHLVQLRAANWLEPEPAVARPGELDGTRTPGAEVPAGRACRAPRLPRRGLTIAALAERLRTREHVLRRVINQGLGYRNFNDFLHAFRIREACERLRRVEDARLPVLSIALGVGYGSIGPFNRAFKARMGMTPTHFGGSPGVPRRRAERTHPADRWPISTSASRFSDHSARHWPRCAATMRSHASQARGDPSMRTVWLTLACCLPLGALAESTLTGDLPRRDGKPLEEIPGLDSHYGVLEVADGRRLRTILTRPAGSTGPSARDPLRAMALLRQHRAAGEAAGRLEPHAAAAGAGIGHGDDAHGEGGRRRQRRRLRRARLRDGARRPSRRARGARRSPDVDPERIVVFGASMGGNYAPLVAAGEPVAGVMIWGGGAKTWFERMLGFERRAKEFAAVPAAELDAPHARARAVLRRLPARSTRTRPHRARTAGACGHLGEHRRHGAGHPLRPAAGVPPAGGGAGLGRGLGAHRCARARALRRVRLVRGRGGASARRRHREPARVRGGANSPRFPRPTTTSTGSRMPRRRFAARAASTTPTPRSA